MEAVEEEGAVEGPAYIDDRYVFGKEEGEIDEEGVSVCVSHTVLRGVFRGLFIIFHVCNLYYYYKRV